MKEYLDQIFYEGLGKSIYYPIEKKLKILNNQNLAQKLIVITKIIYYIIAISIAVIFGLYY